ncbi:hypothetical protein NEP06_07210 [Escherichia coli]|nr:hypothetical protein [Escherichia coli]
MNNEIKFQHIKRLWYLEDGVIKTRHGNRAIKFKPDYKWRFQWFDGDGERHQRRFTNINEAMEFRATIEEPRRQELRALGLQCKRSGNRLTTATMRQINKRDRLRYRCRH